MTALPIFPGSYLKKRRYVRQIIDYYDTIEKRFTDQESAQSGRVKLT